VQSGGNKSEPQVVALTEAVRFSDSCHNGGLFRLLVTANVVPRSPILVTLKMEAIRASETSVLIRAKRCTIPEDGILHSHRRENLKSYKALTGCAL
jgi:hypothetical protein